MKPPENPPNAGKTADSRGTRTPAFSAVSAGSRTAKDVGRSETSPMTELQDALEDAIRRAYCRGWYRTPAYEGEIDPDEMAAQIIDSPGHMRRLVGIQQAAWDAVRERVDVE